MTTNRQRIGLIAGSGALAGEFAARARERGCEVVVAALSSEVRGALEASSDTIAHIPPTQPKRILRFLKDEGVERLAFAGKVEKSLLFQSLKFDLEALRFLRKARDMSDVTIMEAAIAFFEENGFRVLPQTEYLDHLLTPAGTLTRRRLDEEQRRSAEYAFRIAREVAGLDIGQTIVVRKGAVVAVEAIEGTDQTILRGCSLAGKGALICKVARPRQDVRYDIPVVGSTTIRVCREGKAAALILEAGRTFLLDRERLVREADAAGLVLVGWPDDERP